MGEKFKFKYTALTIKERKEIDSIRREYLPKEETMTKLERLRYLDSVVKTGPTILALSLGVIGLLIFGVGMTFFLEWISFWYLGIPCSLIGLIVLGLAYPIYNKKLKQNKAKYSQEIISLSNELLSDNNE